MSEVTTSGGGAPDTIDTFKGDNEPMDKSTFLQKIQDAIANLADVTVATVISDVKVTLDERGRLESVQTGQTDPVPAIITNVNLINGNVTNVIGPSLKDDEPVATFHQDLVDKAVKVLPENLKSLASLVQGFFDGTSKKKESS